MSGRTWAGTLAGYTVHVSRSSGGWFAAVLPGGQYTEVVLRAAWLRDGARRAREWVEGKAR